MVIRMESRIGFETGKAKKVMAGASKTVKFTFKVLKLIFVVIILYTVLASIWIYYDTNSGDFLNEIAILSIGGFWAFFLGYFGWRMGQTVENYLTPRKRN